MDAGSPWDIINSFRFVVDIVWARVIEERWKYEFIRYL